MEKSLEERFDRILHRLDSSIELGTWLVRTLVLMTALSSLIILAAVVTDLTGDLWFIEKAVLGSILLMFLYTTVSIYKIFKTGFKGGKS